MVKLVGGDSNVISLDEEQWFKMYKRSVKIAVCLIGACLPCCDGVTAEPHPSQRDAIRSTIEIRKQRRWEKEQRAARAALVQERRDKEQAERTARLAPYVLKQQEILARHQAEMARAEVAEREVEALERMALAAQQQANAAAYRAWYGSGYR